MGAVHDELCPLRGHLLRELLQLLLHPILKVLMNEVWVGKCVLYLSFVGLVHVRVGWTSIPITMALDISFTASSRAFRCRR